MAKTVETVATRAEEVTNLEVASRGVARTEAASVEVSEVAMIEVALEAAAVDSVEVIDITSKMMTFLRSLTTTPNKSKLVLLCLQLNLGIVPTKVASRVVKITRNTVIVEAIIILLLIITMEADTIMAVANNLIIHLVAITNTNNELNKTTRQQT
jgi:hypothetical protein